MYCRTQLVKLAKAHDEFRRHGATLVAISVDPKEDSIDLARELGIHFPLLTDPQLDIANAYGVVQEGRDLAVPAVFVIDSRQQIRWRAVAWHLANRPSTADITAAVDDARRSAR